MPAELAMEEVAIAELEIVEVVKIDETAVDCEIDVVVMKTDGAAVEDGRIWIEMTEDDEAGLALEATGAAALDDAPDPEELEAASPPIPLTA